jgi:hypothetical protein
MFSLNIKMIPPVDTEKMTRLLAVDEAFIMGLLNEWEVKGREKQVVEDLVAYMKEWILKDVPLDEKAPVIHRTLCAIDVEMRHHMPAGFEIPSHPVAE